MSGRLLLASHLALALVVVRPAVAAAQTPVPEAPTDDAAITPEAPPEPTAPDEPITSPDAVTPSPSEPVAEPPHTVDPPPAEDPEPEFEPEALSPAERAPSTPPPPPAKPRPVPPASESAPVAATPVAEPPPAAPKPATEPAREKPPKTVREKTEADKRQRFRHGGFILDARVGGTGCIRTHCQGAAGHRAAPGLHLGGFVGFNLFGLIELGVEGGWNTLRPRNVAGRNAMALYGLDPAQLQQAITADVSLPIPMIDFSNLDVVSATSRAFDVGPSLRLHLIRKGRGLLFVGAGVHYQLWRNKYETQGGDLSVSVHGASLPLRVGAGAFITRNLALMAEVSYAPAIFGGMTFRLGDKRGLAPFKVIEDTAGIKVGRGMPHFWTIALTLRFRL